MLYYNFIHSITQTITLSRHKMIDVALLDDEELTNITPEELELFETTCIYARGIIAILIKKPIFNYEKCRWMKLYPVPNWNEKEIVGLSDELFVCKKEIRKKSMEVINDKCLQELFTPRIENSFYKKNEKTPKFCQMTPE